MIRRRTAHLIFGSISATLLAALGWQSLQIHQQTQLDDALQAIPLMLTEPGDASASRHAIAKHPAVQIKTATALAKGNQLEAAEKILNELIRESNSSKTSLGAQFNLANAYLRAALAYGEKTSSQSLPLVELAKQGYRDLLLIDNSHWGARYNLERALRLAPEGSDRVGDEPIDPVKSVNVIVPGFEKKDLP